MQPFSVDFRGEREKETETDRDRQRQTDRQTNRPVAINGKRE